MSPHRKATLHSPLMVDLRFGIPLVILALAAGLATVFVFRTAMQHDPAGPPPTQSR